MAPNCLPLELLYEIVPFIPAEKAAPNALSSCWLLQKLLQPRVVKWQKAVPITGASISSVELAVKEVENPPEKHLPETETKTVPLTRGMRQLDETDKNAPNERKLEAIKEAVPITGAMGQLDETEMNVPNERKLKADKEDKASTSAVVPEAKDVENQPKKHLPKTETKAAKSCEETIVLLIEHLNEFGLVADGVFVILENLAKEKGKEYAKKVQDMKKHCSNITEFKYPHASCSDSPVLLGRVDQLQVRAIAITKNSIKVEWYPISGGIIDNVTINKYVLHHRRRFQSDEWFTTEHAPQNGAFNVELRPLHPASKYEFYISAFGGKGKELRKSRHVCATTKSD